MILGAVETVLISPPGAEFSARIDTGAAVSSLIAYQVQEFLREGKMWVRFNTSEQPDGSRMVECPVKKILSVRQSSRGVPQPRYIVDLQIRLGERKLTGEFSLADRRNMDYPVLIGRNLLEGNALVDVSRQNLLEHR